MTRQRKCQRDRFHTAREGRRRGLPLVLAAALAACSPSAPGDGTSAGQQQTAPAAAAATNPANAALDGAASFAENLVEAVAANDRAAADTAYGELNAALQKLTDAELGSSAAEIRRLAQSMNDAWSAQDRIGAAMAAVTLYRRLQEAKDWTGSVVPLEVSLLDHDGFRTQLLLASPPIDWAAVTATAADARKSLTAIEGRLGDGNLRQLVTGVVEHLEAGAKAQDGTRVAIAARDLLAAVDLVEQDFSRNATKPAG